EHLSLGLELVEVRRLAVDRPALGDLNVLTGLRVEHVTGHVEHATLRDVADGHRDRRTRVDNLLPADDTVRRLQRNGTDDVIAEVLGNLERDRVCLAADGDLGGERIVDAGNRIVRELDVHDRTGHTGDPADCTGRSFRLLRSEGSVCRSSFFSLRRRSAKDANSASSPPTIYETCCVHSAGREFSRRPVYSVSSLAAYAAAVLITVHVAACI